MRKLVSKFGLGKKRKDWVLVEPNVKRVVINGREILVKRIIEMNKDRVVYEDLQGKIHVVRRKPPYH